MTPKKKPPRTGKKFRAWIKSYGDTNLAAALGISQIAVMQWRHGKSAPELSRCARIIELSGNTLTFTDIFAEAL